MAGIEREGENQDSNVDAFLSSVENNQEEAPSDSPDEEAKVGESPSQKGEEPSDDGKDTSDANNSLPFNKHPRWQATQQELKETRERNELLAQELSELREMVESKSSDSGTIAVPEPFKRLFGDNPDLYTQFRDLTQAEAESIVAARMDELQNRQTQEEQARNRELEEAKQYIELSLADLAEETGLPLMQDSTERNEILQIAEEFAPTDSEGNLDLRKAYKIWGKTKEASNKQTERKQIAGMTTSTSQQTGNKPAKLGSLQGKDWRQYI